MSGIVGIFHFDGRPVPTERLAEALARLQHRGPDGAETWTGNGVGLGHLAFHTTPEAELERQPHHTADGHCVLVADARIDNRAELDRELGLRERLGALTDAGLIMAAYERWGEGCAVRLIGDFAFAIWDGRERRLFCARDHAGVRPFYYHYAPGGRFVFSSEMKGILAFGVPEEVNRERIADYLANIVYDDEYTFYRHISRLPPAHTLTVSAEGIRLQRYWALDPDREIQYASDEEYAEAFRDVFTEAVRCRVRAPDPVGLTLSGGLDSSAVACVAQRLLTEGGRPPLHTFSNVFNLVPECDERPYIEAVLSEGRYVSHYIAADEATYPLSSIAPMVRALDRPFAAPGISTSELLRRRLVQEGVRVVLNGHGGDEVVSRAGLYLKEMALRGEWRGLFREIAQLPGEDTGGTPGRMWFRYILYGTERWLGRYPHTYPLRRPIRAWINRSHGGEATGTERSQNALRYVSRALAAEVDLAERYRAAYRGLGGTADTVREEQYTVLVHPIQTLAHEVLSEVHAAAGVEERVPFWDRRLLEFCLALPVEQKRRNGYGRYILRQALRTELPNSVRDRQDKAGFQANLVHGMCRNDEAALDHALSTLEELEPFADVGVLRQELENGHLEGNWHAAALLTRATALKEWLRTMQSPECESSR
jgi:asparagine synthase (glutamine-hydrolysing)